MSKASLVIAETFGLDAQEMSEYRYQATKTKQAIYVIGDRYFTVNTTPPNDEYSWGLNNDQFAAKRHNTFLWVADGGKMRNEIEWAWKVRLDAVIQRVEQAHRQLQFAQQELIAEYDAFLNASVVRNAPKDEVTV